MTYYCFDLHKNRVNDTSSFSSLAFILVFRI